MGKSSGGGSQTTTALPSPQQAPYLSDIYRQAQARYNLSLIHI